MPLLPPMPSGPPGSSFMVVTSGDDEDVAVGFDRWRKALETFESAVPILVENTAGGGNAVVREVANYGPLWEAIGDQNVGVCLDTCHRWAGGRISTLPLRPSAA